MNDQKCPEKQRLAEYATGKLPEKDASSIEEHLEACPACENTIEKIEAESNTLASGLRASQAQEPTLAAAEYKRVMQELVQLPQGGETSSASSSSASSDGAPPLAKLGPYELLTKLGEGGMGAVYKARHEHLGKIVAIKILPKKSVQDKDAVARFRREMKAVGQLHHPNIVTAFDAGEADGTHFLVMEYVEGSDLATLVKDRGPLSIEVAVSHLLQAAKGLAFAHSKGIVHRDIKPANLLVDVDGVVKVLDMGLARLDGDGATLAAHDGLTQSGQVMGTVDYMAPEQAFDTRHADARADVYSLGCTLYRILTGKNLYSGETLVQKFLAHREQPIPSLAAVRTDVPKPLDALYQRMVAKKPEDRPSMAETVAVLETLTQREMSPSPKVAPAAKSGGNKKPPVKMILAAAAGFVIVLLGIWVIVRDKDGNVIAKFKASDGATVEMSAITSPEKSASSNPQHPVPSPKSLSSSPYDRFRREDISPHELKVAGMGDAAHAPPELVGVIGDSRYHQFENLTSVAFSSDGKRLASSDGWNLTTVWDRATGQMQWSYNQLTHDHPCWSVFSPDGTRLAVCSPYVEAVVLLDAATGDKVREIPVKKASGISGLAFTRDGKQLVGAGKHKEAYLWDVATGSEVRRFVGHTHDSVDTLSLSPDDKLLVTGSGDKTVRVWEVATGQELRQLEDTTNGAQSLAFLPDGKRVVVGLNSPGERAGVWDATTGKRLFELIGTRVAASGDGHKLATMKAGGGLEILWWDAATGKQLFSTSLPVWTNQLTFSPDSDLLASASGPDRVIRLYSTATGQEVTDVPVLSGSIQYLAVSENSARLSWQLCNALANTALVWDVAQKKTLFQSHPAKTDRPALSRDGLWVCSAEAGSSGCPRVWNVATGKELLPETTNGGGPSAFGPNSAQVAIANRGLTTVWDVQQRRELFRFGDSKESVSGLDWCHATNQIATCNPKEGVKIWDASTGEEAVQLQEQPAGSTWLWLSPDGARLSVFSGPKTQVFDLTTGKSLFAITQLRDLHVSRFSPDSKSLAIGDRSGKLWIVDATTGQSQRQWKFMGSVTSVAFAPDGRHLLAGMGNSTILILRLADPTAPLAGEGPEAKGSAVDNAWLKQVTTLPPAKQIEAVAKKMQELNPGFDGKLTDAEGRGLPKVERGVVTVVSFESDHVTDLSPLKAFSGLTYLRSIGSSSQRGKLADLTPLRGLKLTTLIVRNNEIGDLSPLTGMPLMVLDLAYNGGKIIDLSPLQGMPLTWLDIVNAQVADLSPLAGMPLTHLVCGATKVTDLSPLRSMPLIYLNCGGAAISDLSPLKGMPLTEMQIHNTRVADLSPLRGMPLVTLHMPGTRVTDLSPLADCKQLNSVSAHGSPVTAASVATLQQALPQCKITWHGQGSGTPNETGTPPPGPRPASVGENKTLTAPPLQQWMKDVAALPAEKQIEAVSKKLQELNPGFDGKLTDAEGRGLPKVEQGTVTELTLFSDNVSDISPLRAFAGLKVLICRAKTGTKGKLVDLSPLKGLPLTSLDIGQNDRLLDLSPLTGMSLTNLHCHWTQVSDLSPLRRMPLTNLHLHFSPASDLSPLEGMPLTALNCSSTKVTDLSPLRGAPLAELNIGGTKVADLSPLRGMRLLNFYMPSTQVTDLSPLAECKQLKSVTALGTPVTAASVAALQQALPKCKITWQGSNTPNDAGTPQPNPPPTGKGAKVDDGLK